METKIIEATNGPRNWGKFMVARWTDEWERRPLTEPGMPVPLLGRIGWTREHLLVLDLRTGEGAVFKPGGLAAADLEKRRIWVCPLFQPFLTWLYLQDLRDLAKLPDAIDLPDAPFDVRGYRRPGPSPR